MLMTVGTVADGQEQDEETEERKSRLREGQWVARGTEICKQI